MVAASPTPHSRLILSPLHIFQKGRSRVSIDDHRWWLTNIEFQPSSWSKGSYLNVGAMWLWSEHDYLSFDVGSRVEELVTYESEIQFEPEARRLALAARRQVVKFRKQSPSIAAAARFLEYTSVRHGRSVAAVSCRRRARCIGQIGRAHFFS